MKHAANIAAVAALQPDYMGFIFYEPSPRFIPEVSAELIRYIPASIKTTGVFVNEKPDVVLQKIARHSLKAVQLHGNESPAYCAALKAAGVEVIKAFGVDECFTFAALTDYLETTDYFLFDTATQKHGGSGKTFDWTVLAHYTDSHPYFLSGGIALEHVETLNALADERLYGIDINSRFELEPGLKDVDEVHAFFNRIRK